MSIKAFAGLGAAQIGYALAAVAVAGLAGFGGGFYVGGGMATRARRASRSAVAAH
jgi:hypothetical protein